MNRRLSMNLRRGTLAALATLALWGSGDLSLPAGKEESREFILLYNVNNLGFIDVCGCKRKKIRQGSITRRASYVTQLRARRDDILLLDGGNTFFDREDRKAKPVQLKQLREKAKVLVESYNRIGYKAMVLGHLDLSLL